MAQVPRAPRDNEVKNLFSRKSWSYEYDSEPRSGMVQTCEDRRPSYSYGNRTRLPGGLTFIEPTSYQRSQYEAVVTQPFYGSKKAGKEWAYDEGREAGVFVTHGKYTNSLFGGDFHPSTNIAPMNQAVTKALLRIADEKAGIGEDLLTFRQTLSLFLGKGSLLLGALNVLRGRKQWHRFAKLSARELGRNPIDAAARAYIEYVYGLRPLVQDVYGIAELLKEQGLHTFLLSGKGSANGSRYSTETDWSGSYSYTRIRELQGGNAHAHARCQLYARIDPDHQGLRSLNQLGLINPLALAWAVTPWSFVVDWFVPIQPVLQALTAPAGLIFVGGSKAVKVTQSRYYNFQVDSTGFSPLGADIRTEGLVTVSYRGYTREKLTKWPLPGFYFSSNPFAGDRPLKALALGILQLQRFKNSL